jgi:hypothetical protein
LAGVAQDAAVRALAALAWGAAGAEVALVRGPVAVVVLTVAELISGHTHHGDAAAVHADLVVGTALGEVIGIAAGIHAPYVALVASERPPEAFGAPAKALLTSATAFAGLDLFSYRAARVDEVRVPFVAAPTRFLLALGGGVRLRVVPVATAR